MLNNKHVGEYVNHLRFICSTVAGSEGERVLIGAASIQIAVFPSEVLQKHLKTNMKGAI